MTTVEASFPASFTLDDSSPKRKRVRLRVFSSLAIQASMHGVLGKTAVITCYEECYVECWRVCEQSGINDNDNLADCPGSPLNVNGENPSLFERAGQPNLSPLRFANRVIYF